MLGERIWGQDFLDSMNRPHPDPEIRKMEEQMLKLSTQFYQNETLKIIRKRKIEYDLLPEYYKRINV